MKQFFYPYLLLKDTMKAASYYKDMFQGEIIYIMYGKDTPNCPEDRLEEVVHLQLKVNDNQIFMAEHNGNKPNESVQLHLDYEDKNDMVATFNRFTAESEVIQELGETYWGAYFGVLKDKYDVTWQFHFMIEEE